MVLAKKKAGLMKFVLDIRLTHHIDKAKLQPELHQRIDCWIRNIISDCNIQQRCFFNRNEIMILATKAVAGAKRQAP